MSDLDSTVFKKTRNRIYSKNSEHPWLTLSDEEMLTRAGLIKKDIETHQKGLTLAAALLFGKEETIQGIIPQYKIDILVKQRDLARYDDRLDIRTNLLEAYPAIMGFLERYLPDPFYMEKDVRLSLREKIFREAVANLLVHREYLHQFPARIIIYRGQVEFTNPCNPVYNGNIDNDDCLPNQKNPIISKFFLQLGWVEEIGSGIYNIKKYLPLYTPGRKAIFNEDIVFTTIIPIPSPDDLQKRQTTPQDKAFIHDDLQKSDQVIPQDMLQETPQVTPQDKTFIHDDLQKSDQAIPQDMLQETLQVTPQDKTFIHDDLQKSDQTIPQDMLQETLQVTPQDKTFIHDDLQISDQATTEVTPQVIKLLEASQGEMSREELLSKLELKDRKHLRKEYLNPAVETGLLALTIPDKPNSKHQKYHLTEKGKAFLKNRKKQNE